MRKAILLLAVVLLAGCISGSISEAEARDAVTSTDSYRQLDGNVTVTTWEVNRSAFQQAANISGTPTEREAVLYGLQEFSDFPTEPGFIVRATGTTTGYYYHVGNDGKVTATVSMESLQRQITSAMQQALADMHQDIQQMQQCSMTDITIQTAFYDQDTGEAVVDVLNMGQRTVPTIRVEVRSGGDVMKSATIQQLAAGDHSTVRIAVEARPDAARAVPTGCPAYATTRQFE